MFSANDVAKKVRPHLILPFHKIKNVSILKYPETFQEINSYKIKDHVKQISQMKKN